MTKRMSNLEALFELQFEKNHFGAKSFQKEGLKKNRKFCKSNVKYENSSLGYSSLDTEHSSIEYILHIIIANFNIKNKKTDKNNH